MARHKGILVVSAIVLTVWATRGFLPGQTPRKQNETNIILSENKLIEAYKGGNGLPRKQPPDEEGNTYRVVKVTDGDTIKVNIDGRVEPVRFIGVNTPEIHHPQKSVEAWGKEAAAYTAKLLAGQKVRLIYDVQPRDRYGRLLAYVYTSDGTFVNALLVKEGYAQVMTVPPNVKYQALFTELQKMARKSRKGLWGLEEYSFENPPPS
ncbi:MAG: thermonuclease family protein [Eubacteriales bacterium]